MFAITRSAGLRSRLIESFSRVAISLRGESGPDAGRQDGRIGLERYEAIVRSGILERRQSSPQIVAATDAIESEGLPVPCVCRVSRIRKSLRDVAEEFGRAPIFSAVQRLTSETIKRIGGVRLTIGLWWIARDSAELALERRQSLHACERVLAERDRRCDRRQFHRAEWRHHWLHRRQRRHLRHWSHLGVRA